MPSPSDVPGGLREAARVGAEFRVSTLSIGSLRVSQEPSHQLPADAVREALLSEDAVLDPRGIRIVGAGITGKLDLRHVCPTVGLALVGCAFDHDLVLDDARLPWLTLSGSVLPRLTANGLAVGANVNLDNGFTVEASSGDAVELSAAHIHGKAEPVRSTTREQVRVGPRRRPATRRRFVLPQGAFLCRQRGRRGHPEPLRSPHRRPELQRAIATKSTADCEIRIQVGLDSLRGRFTGQTGPVH